MQRISCGAERGRDATVAVDEDVVREQVVVAHDVGHVDRACPFDHRFESVNVGHDLAAAVGDLVYGAHRPRDRVGVVPRCLAAVDEREQRVAPAMVLGGVRAVKRSPRRRNGDAPSRQLSGQRQYGVAVGPRRQSFTNQRPSVNSSASNPPGCGRSSPTSTPNASRT